MSDRVHVENADLVAGAEEVLASIDRQFTSNRCKCFDLGTILPSDFVLDNSRVDHLCDGTARASCNNWLTDNISPEPNQERIVVAVGTGRFTNAKHQAQWPIPLYDESKRIYAVIRQVVEEDPLIVGERMAIAFRKRSEWHQLLETLRTKARAAGAMESNGKCAVDLQNFRDEAKQWRGVQDVLVALGRFGLPQTLSTARYTISQIDGINRGLPTRGLFVTSFAICGADFRHDMPSQQSRRKVVDGEQMLQSCSYPSAWVTDDLLHQAQLVLNKHRIWWEGLPGVRLPKIVLKGRPVHDLERDADIQRHLAGQLSEQEVLQRERTRNPPKPSAGSPSVQNAATNKRTRAALARAKAKIKMTP